MPDSKLERFQVDIVLVNLRNAESVWGQTSTQFEACKKIAEGVLKQQEIAQTDKHDAFGLSFEETVSKLESLAIISSS